MATYDLKYPGAAIDAILDTAYDLQNAGYIFRGLASEYSNTPTERSWVLAGEGETGHGFISPIPKGYIGVCVFNGTSWTGKLVKCVSIDSAPTPGSTNAVSSGGAYAALNQLATGVAEALDNMQFTDVTPPADQYEQLKLKLATTDSGIERIITYLTFLSATTSKAGLLSAADKAKLDAILGNLRSLEIDDTTAYADLGDKIVESIKATIGGTEETISTFQILAATASKAGLLSASDKAKLDALWSSGYQFVGIATPSTTPVSTTSKIFYIATEAGTYFNSVTVTQGINIIYKSGDAWSVAQVVGIDNEPTAGSENVVESGGVFTAITDKEYVYMLDGNSYIINNVIYIDNIVRYGVKGSVGEVFSIQTKFTVVRYAVLVFDRTNNTVVSKPQANVVNTDDILLVCSGNDFYPLGKLIGNLLKNKPLVEINIEVGMSDTAITNTGSVVSAPGYSISAPLHLTAGTCVSFTTQGYILGAFCKYNENTDTYTPILAYGDDGILSKRRGDVYIVEDGEYVLCSYLFQQQNFYVGGGDIASSIDFGNLSLQDSVKVPTVGALAGSIDSVPTKDSDNLVKSGGVHEVFSQLNTEMYGCPFTSIANKYIKPDGTIGNSSVGFYTNPITVKAGETLTYTIKGNNCAILSTYENGVYSPVVIAPASDTWYRDQTYTAASDGYVAFSGTPDTLVLSSSISKTDRVNTDLSEKIKDTEFVYTLYGNSSIVQGFVHIDQLIQYGVKGAVGNTYTINNTFEVPTGWVLVFDRATNTVLVKMQANVTDTDDILLVSSNGTDFFKLGKLLGGYLTNKTKKIPFSTAQTGKAITDTGMVVSASGYTISAPIFLASGTNVVIRTAGYILGAFCKYNADLGTYTPIISYGDDGVSSLRNAFTTIVDDGYYVVSTRLTNQAFLYVSNVTPYEYDLELVPGTFDTRNGAIWSSADGILLSTFISAKMLKIPEGATIAKINGIETGEDYYIVQFDDNFNYLEYKKNNLALHKKCRYIRLGIGKDSSYTYSKRTTKIIVVSDEPCELVFSTLPSLASSRWIWHTYEVKNTQPIESTSTPSSSFLGEITRIYSKCYIVLPKDYSPNGKPCPVIINCHGTSQIKLNSSSLEYNATYVDFLVKCGYAVIGCFSQASLNWRNDNELNVPSSLCMSAYQGMWDYLTSLYNIDKTGAYVFGYSAGGAETILLSQIKTIPIRCAASLAGTVDAICNMRILTGAGTNNDVFERFGLTYTTLPGGLSSNGAMRPVDSDIKEYLMEHLDNIKPYNALTFHSTLDYYAFEDRFMDIRARTQELEADTTLNNLFNSAKVNLNTPLKIWHAIDDVNVPIQLSRWYAKMVQNGGGICFLREFPSGCGAHNAVGNTDNASLTPMVDYVTPYGETVNVPVAYAEMVEWFRKW